MERRKRTYIHKGKTRIGLRRLPRKLKKKRKKERQKNYDRYKTHLINLHGDNWIDYWIYGG